MLVPKPSHSCLPINPTRHEYRPVIHRNVCHARNTTPASIIHQPGVLDHSMERRLQLLSERTIVGSLSNDSTCKKRMGKAARAENRESRTVTATVMGKKEIANQQTCGRGKKSNLDLEKVANRESLQDMKEGRQVGSKSYQCLFVRREEDEEEEA